ncbi:hypothetical protein MY5147_006912, partial [Beauveria neobassiana]
MPPRYLPGPNKAQSLPSHTWAASGHARLAAGAGGELLGNGPPVARAAALELLAADAVPGAEVVAGSAGGEGAA